MVINIRFYLIIVDFLCDFGGFFTKIILPTKRLEGQIFLKNPPQYYMKPLERFVLVPITFFYLQGQGVPNGWLVYL